MKKILVLIFSLFFCSNIFAEPVKQFVVIGDSLSDNGNLYKALFKIIPKSPPYFNGRFTNGPTWAEDVGKYYFDKYNADFKIFAYGGATAILHNPLHDKFVAPITLDGEMLQYLWSAKFTDKSKVLYALWIGANDYLYDEQDDTVGLVNSVVDTISSSLNTLLKQGARTIVVLNLPDLARTPFAESHHNAARLHSLTIMHNQKLAEAVNSLKTTYPDAKILTVNIYDIFNDLLDHTDQYNKDFNINLTNTREACWKGGMTFTTSKLLERDLQKAMQTQGKSEFDAKTLSHLILNNPSLSVAYQTQQAFEQNLSPCEKSNEYVFWDELHPTDTVHSVLARIFVNTVASSR